MPKHTTASPYIDTQLFRDHLDFTDFHAFYVQGTIPTGLPHFSNFFGAKRVVDVHIDSKLTYESALIARLTSDSKANITILLGGVGSGKSTTARYVLHQIHAQARKLSPNYVNHFHCYNGLNHQPGSLDSGEQIVDRFDFAIWRSVFLMTISCLSHDIVRLILQKHFKSDEVKTILARAGDVTALAYWFLSTDVFHSTRSTEFQMANLPIARPFQDSITESLRENPTVEIFMNKLDSLDKTKLHDDYNITTSHRRHAESLLSALIYTIGDKLNSLQLRSRWFFCIDNLDQFPTQTIHEIVGTVQNRMKGHEFLRILLPVRPTRAGAFEYSPTAEKINTVVTHYGPLPSEVVILRLDLYAFSKSREEHRQGKRCLDNLGTEFMIPATFSCAENDTISDTDIDFFMAIALLWRQINQFELAGLDAQGGHFVSGPPNIHQEFKSLLRLSIRDDAAQDLSSTLRAIVGSNIRNALAHGRSFFDRWYKEPYCEQLIEFINRVPGSAQTIYVSPYKLLIDPILFDPSDELHVSIQNLFAIKDDPKSREMRLSLIKPYIISYLAFKGVDVTVHQLARELISAGFFPKDVLTGLLALSNENCGVVWLSEFDIRSDQKSHIKRRSRELVVELSDSGEHYATSLFYTFDYLWACNAQIEDSARMNLPFSARFKHALAILRSLRSLEYNHIAFARFMGSSDPSINHFPMGEFLSLRVCYHAVAHIAKVNKVQLSRFLDVIIESKERARQIDLTAGQMQELAAVLSEFHSCYRRLYGTRNYELVYSEERRIAYVAGSEYLDACLAMNLPESIVASARYLLELLSEDSLRDVSGKKSPLKEIAKLNTESEDLAKALTSAALGVFRIEQGLKDAHRLDVWDERAVIIRELYYQLLLQIRDSSWSPLAIRDTVTALKSRLMELEKLISQPGLIPPSGRLANLERQILWLEKAYNQLTEVIPAPKFNPLDSNSVEAIHQRFKSFVGICRDIASELEIKTTRFDLLPKTDTIRIE